MKRFNEISPEANECDASALLPTVHTVALLSCAESSGVRWTRCR